MPNAECRMPNAECRMPNAERRTPTAERRTPTAERRTPNAERDHCPGRNDPWCELHGLPGYLRSEGRKLLNAKPPNASIAAGEMTSGANYPGLT
jgi:hypothetical protein